VNATLERVRARVAERFPADLERIRDYLRLPSVSATGEGIRAAAEATGAWIEGAGGSFELVETPGHPLVLGELPGPAGAPRLLRYGMYDVQPAEEPDWTSPPFAAEIRDLPGVGPAVVARGSANSKGCLAAFFLAVEVLRELGAMPPLTVVLMVEGEEELGSPNLPAVVRARAADLRAEVAFDLDLTAGLDGQPELILGCKGLCSLELVAEAGDWGGPAIDLHSSEQAWIASPVWALVHALATLTDADERIRVPGLDGGAAPSDGDARLLTELAETFDPAEHLREANAARYRLPGGAAELALRASYQALGRRPLPYPLAPWCAPSYVFDRILGLPWAAGGVGHAAGAHGPDEYATLAGLQEHVVGAAAFLLAYAAGAAEAPA
jgi:acetylornithine deacetylase/succinyl-diaminopimelate desuccinylase-like protein